MTIRELIERLQKIEEKIKTEHYELESEHVKILDYDKDDFGRDLDRELYYVELFPHYEYIKNGKKRKTGEYDIVIV